MALKHQTFFAPPSSNNFDRVLNWCERDVKNYYELSPSKPPSRFTPLQLLPTRAGPLRVDLYKGVQMNAILENNSIDSNSVSESSCLNMADTISGVNLDVHH